MTETAAAWRLQQEGGSTVLLRFMRQVALHAPAFVTDPLIWVISLRYALSAGRATNRASMNYLTRVLGRQPRFADRHRHARVFAHVFLDRARFLAHGAGAFRLEPAGETLISDLVAEGRGAVLLGAHFGSFEALRAFDRTLPGLDVRYLMFPENAAKSNAILHGLNPGVSEQVIPLTHGREAMFSVFEALDEGKFVAFLGDRMPDSSSTAKLAVPFLGGEIEVPSSPYAAAMAAQVPLILCQAPRLGKDRYAVQFALLHDGRPVPHKDRARETRALAMGYAAHLEELCRAHPFNWFNFFDIWAGPRGAVALQGDDARQRC